MPGNYDHKGGGRRLMEKTILNFHFDYLTTRLSGNMTTAADNDIGKKSSNHFISEMSCKNKFDPF